MYLCREEVQKILDTMDKFPEAISFELLQDGHSGIGSVTSLIVHTTINWLPGALRTQEHHEFLPTNTGQI
jgi:hypothetical protein